MNIAKISSYVLFIGVAIFVGNPVPSTAKAPIEESPAKTSQVAIVSKTTIDRPTTKVGNSELHPELLRICGCESGGGPNHPPRQFETDGSVRRGRVNPNDIGMCQINTEPRNGHVYMAPKLGFDLYTAEGNIAYANWLYEQEGSTPWNSSKPCWGN